MEKMNGVEQKFVTMGIRYSRDEPQITVEFVSDFKCFPNTYIVP